MSIDLLNRALAGRYRVSGEIGRGGTATVYRAHDLKHDRDVALKVLEPHLAAELGTERFLREIRFTAQLDHPHILPLLDSGEADGLLYYVMPLVEGESIRARLQREKQLPLHDALRIAREVADALHHAHRHGVVHRDIKPENILLTGGIGGRGESRGSHARVADFGIARALTAGGDGLTATGLAIGTPAYMSPEQASGAQDVDARTDIYSLGCVLYEMLAGSAPYTGATPQAILSRKLAETAPSLRIVRDTVPPAVEAAVAKALAKVPADRFDSALQFAEALDGPPVSTTIPAARRPMWHVGLPVLGAMAVALLLLSDVGGMRTRLTSSAPSPAIASIAVLPLDNLSGDPQQNYLAAGIHEALIIDLGKLRGLRRVSARASVQRYHGTDKAPRTIGAELGVDALITGSVIRSGDRVRVTANLIRSTTEEPVWSEDYDRDLRDVLTLQDDIVGAIARQVQLRLSSGERAGLATSRRVNPDAYEAYLKGKFQINKLTPDGFEKGMALLQQAIAIDSTEALAYAGLAYGYTMLELFSPATSPDVIPRAKAAALRAVELDETLAEAHLALGLFQGAKEWDYTAAERGMRRALELNPNLAEAHIQFAWHQAIFGTEANAIAEMKRGNELSPLSPLYTAWLGGLYWEFGRFDEAIAEAKNALDLEADFPVALIVLGLAHLDKGNHAEAIAAHERAVALYPRHGFSWTLARTYALTGRQAKARKILGSLESGAPGDMPHPWFVAAAYTAVGDHDKAIAWLETAYAQRILFLTNLRRERAAGATFGALRGDARFQSLLRRLRLTSAS